MSNKIEMRATPVSEKTMKRLTRNADKMRKNKENHYLITTGENITDASYDLIKDKKYIDLDELNKTLKYIGIESSFTLEIGIMNLWKSRGLAVDHIQFKTKGNAGVWTVTAMVKNDEGPKACPNCNGILTVTYADNKKKIVDAHCDRCGFKGGIP